MPADPKPLPSRAPAGPVAKSLDDLAQDLRYGVRGLCKRPGFTAAAVLILGLGIGAVASIYGAAEALVLHPLPYPELERLVVIGEVHPRSRPGDEMWAHPADVREWRALPAFAGIAALGFSMPVVNTPAGPERAVAYRTSRDFFDLLGIAPAEGRSFAVTGGGSGEAVPGPQATPERAGAASDEVVLSHRYWQRTLGGADDVLGRSILVDGRPTTIVGVLPPGAGYPMGTDLWMPLALTEREWASFESPALRVVARLAPGTTVQQARRSLAGVAGRLQEAHARDVGPRSVRVQPLLDEVTWGSRVGLALLGSAAGCLLLLVCVSVAHMQLARATTRGGEMALRAALGASRSRLIRQLLTEGSLLAGSGALLGSGLAVAGTRYIRAQLSTEGLRFFFAGVHDIRVDASVLAVTLATALASTLLFGILPALRASALGAGAALTGHARRATRSAARHPASRRWLIGFQVATSILLVTGAATMVRQSGALSRVGHGPEDEVVTLRVQLPAARYDTASRQLEYFSTALRRLQRLPGVRDVALSDALPSTRLSTRELHVEAPASLDVPLRAGRRIVGGEYFAALQIPLEEGRAFRPGDDAGASPVGVVNRELAQRLGHRADVVGRRIRFSPDEPWTVVVGVVGDQTPLEAPVPTLYRPYTQYPRSTLRFLLPTDGDPAATLAAARQQLLSLDDSLPLAETGTLQEVAAERSRGLWLFTDLLSAFATSAFLLALVGAYALVAADAGRRTRELGIRLALGARRAQLSTLLLRQALLPVVLGTAVGLATALALSARLARHRLLSDALDPDPTFLVALSLALLAITALAAYLPARRASTTDPATSLRAD